MFFLATTSWVMTVLINASPFMRFDGYFIASDVLDLPNLHERSGALAKTWMRRTLLGFEDKWPEAFGDHKRRVLIGFALFTWLYRLVVIAGIAITVYFYFFKLLGIALMLVEVVWFIGKPVMRELEVWNKRRAEIHPSRKRWLAIGLLAGLALLLFPFSSNVSGHGWYPRAGAAAHSRAVPGTDRVDAGAEGFQGRRRAVRARFLTAEHRQRQVASAGQGARSADRRSAGPARR